MSVHILALREFFSKKQNKNIKAEVWFEKGLRAPNVEAIFSNPQAYLEGVAESERWNIYYTVAECLEEKGRKLLVQHHIPFDIDKIDIPETPEGEVDLKALGLLAKVATDALGVEYEKCGVVFSGGGVQIIVGTTHPIESVEFFDQTRAHYKALCDKINLRLMQAKLKGSADPSVWSPARLMRYPETKNVKPDRQPRIARVINSTIERLDFDIRKASGLPDVPRNQQISTSVVSTFPDPDVKAILDQKTGCKFIQWAQTSPNEVTEPEWYAAVSITSRFPNGRQFTHKMSEGHKGYSYSETDQKIEQSMQASGPRTCENINAISGGKCQGCKHFKTNLISPIMIEGPDHVKTQKFGFYNTYINKETGEIKKGKPDFEGLAKYFGREHRYKTVEVARTVWIYNGKYYSEMSRDRVLQYAHTHFDPKPNTQMRAEFFETVRMHHMESADWFSKSIEGKMNFQNGVLDVHTGQLLEHDVNYGFRSILPCNYAPEADAPRFKQFMDEVTLGRQELIDIIQEYLGYVFANGDCKYQKILILLGTGENGKSKLVDLVRSLAGEEGFSSLSVKSMFNEQNRALMEGKLVNVAEENSRDSFRDTEFIKNMASGGFISVKRLYTQPYEFRNKTKLIMLCNEAPYTADNTHGFYRRLMLVPFDQVFSDAKGNIDRNILEKLMAELPGIFNWIMEGYRRLERQGQFSRSDISDSLLKQYKSDTDSILAWSNDTLEYTTEEYEINRAELYTDYCGFCDQHGLKPLGAPRLFSYLRDFVKKNGGIPEECKRRKDNVRIWTIKNIKHLCVPKF